MDRTSFAVSFLPAKFQGVVLRANLRGASRNIITPTWPPMHKVR